MSKDVQSEIVQVAAVAAAMLENMQFGKAYSRALAAPGGGGVYDQQGAIVAQQIREERFAQDYKWGIQDHTLVEWMMILLEEVGELADALLALEFPTRESFQTSKDAVWAFRVLSHVAQDGDSARSWCEHYEWPERQRQVYEREKKENAAPES